MAVLSFQTPLLSGQQRESAEAAVPKYFVPPSPFVKAANTLLYSKPIKARFTWWRPPRYGVDLNGNGMVDLPNTFEYAHNSPTWDSFYGCECVNGDCLTGGPRFKVMLDGSGTAFPVLADIRPPVKTESREDSPSGARQPPEPDLAAIAGARAGMRQLEFTLAGTPLSQPLVVSTSYATPKVEVCLPEGKYTITLKAVDNYTSEWNAYTRVITVEDFLVVQLGDSYASGEGTPERRVRSTVTSLSPAQHDREINRALAGAWLQQTRSPNFAHILWADDGQPMTWVDQTFSGNVLLPIPTQVAVANFTARLPDFSRFTQKHKDHYRAHRSTFNASSQMAIDIERESSKSSVTYLNLAASGATTDKGILSTYAGRDISRFYDANTSLASQITELKSIVGNRTIDALIISIGGNDAGFANAAVGLLLRDRSYMDSPSILIFDRAISAGVNTGAWATVENSYLFLPFFVQWSDLLGLNRLPDQFAHIRDAIESNSITAPHVYFTEYPNFGKKFYPELVISPPFGGSSVTIPAHVNECEQVLNSAAADVVPGGLEIDAGELAWAAINVLEPLNRKVREGAVANGWNYVDGIVAAMEVNGMCANAPYESTDFRPQHPVSDRADEGTMRFFRRELESSYIYNHADLTTVTGTMHPNEYGYKAIKKQLRQAVSLPVVLDYERDVPTLQTLESPVRRRR